MDYNSIFENGNIQEEVEQGKREAKWRWEKLREMMKTEGWRIYSAILEERRRVAVWHILATGAKIWRGRLMAIDEIIGIPEVLENLAKEESKDGDSNRYL